MRAGFSASVKPLCNPDNDCTTQIRRKKEGERKNRRRNGERRRIKVLGKTRKKLALAKKVGYDLRMHINDWSLLKQHLTHHRRIPICCLLFPP